MEGRGAFCSAEKPRRKSRWSGQKGECRNEERKACEKHAHRKPEVSYGRLIRVGLVGPKPRAKAVGDGQLVSIPALAGEDEAAVTRYGKSGVPNGHGALPDNRPE